MGGTSLGPAACSPLGQASGGGIFPFGSTVADGLGDLVNVVDDLPGFLAADNTLDEVAMPKPDVRPLPAAETVRLEEPEQGHNQPKALQWHREG